MGVNNVSFDEAMISKSAAGQYLRSKEVSAEEKGQLSAKWGVEFVNQALTVDSTKYEISDDDFDNAKEAGKEAAKDGTGYDGEGGSTTSAVVSAAGAAATAASIVAPRATGQIAQGGLNIIKQDLGNKAVDGLGKGSATDAGQKKLGAYATVILAAAVAAKYWASNHNKDEHEAAMHLLENELPEGQGALYEAQENLEDASEKVTELTEEAEDKNEEANDQIEEKKTLFDFYRQQYNALKDKKAAGEALTQDEKALMKSIAPQMEGTGEEINTISEDTSDEVNGLNDEIGEYQEIYDDSAETIGEVEGVTDFAENFDEQSRTLMYVEGGAQSLNGISAGIAAAKLTASGWWNWAFAAVGYAAAASSGIAAGQQFSWAGDMSTEIHARRDVQELGEQTNEVYEEELDNYAGNIETVEDLELEVPEDLETPTTVAQDTADTTQPATKAEDANKKEEDNNNNDDANKKKDDKKSTF